MQYFLIIVVCCFNHILLQAHFIARFSRLSTSVGKQREYFSMNYFLTYWFLCVFLERYQFPLAALDSLCHLIVALFGQG